MIERRRCSDASTWYHDNWQMHKPPSPLWSVQGTWLPSQTGWKNDSVNLHLCNTAMPRILRHLSNEIKRLEHEFTVPCSQGNKY